MITPLLLAGRILAALSLFWLPGLLSIRLIRFSTELPERLLVSFSLSLTLLLLLNIPLFALRAALGDLIVAWIAIAIGLLVILAFRKDGFLRGHSLREKLTQLKSRERRVTTNTLVTGVVVVMLVLVSVSLFVAGSPIGGEEEIELIITRKIVENASVEVTNILWIKGLASTYVLVPFYLFRAFLSSVSGLDPILVHQRLAFVTTILGLLSFYALAHHLTQSRRIACLFLGLAAAHLLVTPMHLISGPLLVESPSRSLVYRGSFSTQVTFATGLFYSLKGLEERPVGLYVGLAISSFAITLTTQAYSAIGTLHLSGVLLLSLVASLWWKNVERDMLRKAMRRLGFILAGYVLVGIFFVVEYRAFQTQSASIESQYRQATLEVLTGMLSNPLQLLISPPEFLTVCSYFACRGTTFTIFGDYFVRRLTPVLMVGYFASAIFTLFKQSYKTFFIASAFILLPLLMRVPAVAALMLTANWQVFNNLSYELALLQYYAAFFAALLIAGTLASWIERLTKDASRPAWLHTASVAGTGLAIFVGGLWAVPRLLELIPASMDLVHRLKWYIRAHTGSQILFAVFLDTDAILLLYVGLLLSILAARKLAGIQLEWDSAKYENAPSALIAIAAVVPILLAGAGPCPESCNLIQAALHSSDMLALRDPYLAYTQNYATLGAANENYIDRSMFAALLFIRENVPEGSIFASDPDLIRAVPTFTNNYIVHSGLPFDFIEPYFLQYHDEAYDRNFTRQDPFFREDRSLTPDIVETDAEFLRQYSVDYILATPPYHRYVAEILSRLEGYPGVSAEMIYDHAQYTIYRID